MWSTRRSAGRRHADNARNEPLGLVLAQRLAQGIDMGDGLVVRYRVSPSITYLYLLRRRLPAMTLIVKPPSHGGNTGSNPVGNTN